MRPEPTILAIDTSAAHCAAALLVGGDIVTSRFEEMRKGQAERLFPLLEEVLDEANAGWNDLDAIGVGIGPGNFTGIRIAVSAARGLALSLHVPAIGVSLFETTQRLGNWAQVAVPAPRENAYFMDFDKMQAPTLVPMNDMTDAVARSTEHHPKDHVSCLARIAAEKLAQGSEIARPAPLYIRPADAAPSSEPAPVILP